MLGILAGRKTTGIDEIVVILFVISTYWTIKKNGFRGILYYAGCFSAGFLVIGLKDERFADSNLRYALPNYPIICEVYGRISEIEEDQGYDKADNHWTHLLTVCESLKSNLNHRWEYATGVIKMNVSAKHLKGLQFSVDDEFWARGILRLKEGEAEFVPHFSVGQHGSFRIFKNQNRKLRCFPSMDDWRTNLYSRLVEIMGQENQVTRLMAGLTLGMRSKEFSEDIKPFRKSGTSHLFAISGLHIALIAAALCQFLELFFTQKRISSSVSIPLIWIYITLVGMPPSAVRAGIMATIVFLGFVFDRPNHWANSLHFAALFYLLIFPEALFELGFLLSFSAVFWIIYFLPSLNEISRKVEFRDPLLPKLYQPMWKRYMERAAQYSIGLIFISIICWFGTIPFTAKAFGEIQFVGIFLNIVMVPLTSICLISILLGWLTLWLSPWVSGNFFHVGYTLIELMINTAEFSVRGDWSLFHPKINNLYYWGIFYTWMLFALPVWLTKNLIPRIIWFSSAIVLITVQLIDIHTPPEIVIRSAVGDGSHVLSIQQKEHPNFLLDVGRKSIQQSLVHFIPKEANPDAIIVRHASADQLEAYNDWGKMDPEKELHWLSIQNKSFTSPVWRKFQNDAQNFSVDFDFSKRRDFVGASWKFFSANWGEEEEYYRGASDHSLCSYLFDGEKGVLICSPISKQAQSRIFEILPQGRIDGIICTMDKSPYPLEPWFVLHCDPSWILVGDSKFPVNDQFRSSHFVKWKNRLDGIWIRKQSDSGNWVIFPVSGGWKLENRAESVTIYSKTVK